MTTVTATLTSTRHVLHGIAEHLLAAHQRRVTGSIRLQVRDGALSTADLPTGRLELRSGYLVRHPEGLVVPVRGTFAELAVELGVEFGMPDPPYVSASGCGPDTPACLDPAATALIEDAWRIGHRALRRLSGQQPVVWPEHLDVAITLDEVNYGVSPGDSHLEQPYAYVGPHTPRAGDFWNAPFGAARTLTELASWQGQGQGDGADAVLAFFGQGQALAAATAPGA
jgi:hypothetical protein